MKKIIMFLLLLVSVLVLSGCESDYNDCLYDCNKVYNDEICEEGVDWFGECSSPTDQAALNKLCFNKCSGGD